MATEEDPFDRMFDWARSALRDGLSAVAVELLTSYVAFRPSDNYALFLLGESLREVGRAAESERALLAALAIAPAKGHARIMASIGMLKERHGSRDEAEYWFRRATDDEIGAKKGWIWILRGMNSAMAGHFDEAAICHETAAQLPGDPDEAFLNLGYVRRAQARYTEAVDAFQKALEITPDYQEAKTALAGLADIFRAKEFAASVARGAPEAEDDSPSPGAA